MSVDKNTSIALVLDLSKYGITFEQADERHEQSREEDIYIEIDGMCGEYAFLMKEYQQLSDGWGQDETLVELEKYLNKTNADKLSIKEKAKEIFGIDVSMEDIKLCIFTKYS